MYKFNSRWHKIVNNVISNSGWIVVILVSVITVMFTQLGTWHRESGNIHALTESYSQYGNIHNTVILNVDELEVEDLITIYIYYYGTEDEGYLGLITDLENKKSALETSNLELLETHPLYIRNMRQIEQYNESITKFESQYNLFVSGKIKSINEQDLISKKGVQQFTWVGEYTYDRIFGLATTDVYSWILVIMLAFSAIIVKIQGNKTGKNSGFKLEWKTMARHATLSEKIAPKNKAAEDVCIRLNEEELYAKREAKLQYVALRYEDVFAEDGTFLNNPSFVQVEVMSYKKGTKTIHRENPYQKKLLKKQKKTVEHLKKFRIKEVHTHILLESKAEAKERFDFGESLKTRERKTFWTNIITSFVTVLPMFTAVSVFVVTEDRTNLLLGALGIVLNLVSLLFNMFGSYDYIINVWKPGVLKKCDLLLAIGIEIGVVDEVDRNWEANLEKEMLSEHTIK